MNSNINNNTDKKKLIELLSALLSSYPEDNRHPFQKAREGFLWKDNEYGKNFLGLLKNDEKYLIFDNHLQAIGNVATNTSFSELIEWLLNRARIAGAEKAVEEVEIYLDSSEVEVEFIELVVGLLAEQEYTFCNGVKLTSPHNIKNAMLANDLVAESFTRRTPHSDVTAVFIHPYIQKIQHIKNTDEQPHFTGISHIKEISEKIEDTAMCVSLARNVKYGIHPMASAIVSPDNLPYICPISGWSIIPFKQPPLSPAILKIEFDQANSILTNFIGLKEDFKKKLRIPLKKLNAFGSGESLVDKAIDLRICLESIFLDDGNKEQLRYRLALRAALFLESIPEKRKDIFKFIQKVYDTTSTAVHTGKFSEKDSNDVSKTLEDAAILAKKTLIKLIDEDEINWLEIELKNEKI